MDNLYPQLFSSFKKTLLNKYNSAVLTSLGLYIILGVGP